MSHLRIVHQCDHCEAEATCIITDDGRHVGRRCRPCFELLERRFATLKRMLTHGTPVDVALRWLENAS